MYFSRKISSLPQSSQTSQHNDQDSTTPIIITSSQQPNMKSPQSHQQSTPLSINKTQQSNFNLYQQGLLLNSQHHLPNLSPASDYRPLTKSFTPVPMWYTTQEGRWKMREDSFAVFGDEESDKENMFCGVNEQEKWRVKIKDGSQHSTPKSYSKPFQQQHQNISSRKSNSNNKKDLPLSHLQNSSIPMKRSKQRILNCSNIKTTLNLPDNLLLPNSMDSHHFVSLDSMLLQKQSQQQIQEHQNHHKQPLIHIQQPSPSSSYSPQTNNNIYCSSQDECGMVGNVQMILSELPQQSENGNSLCMDESSRDGNQVIEYFLTEQDDERQSYSMSKNGDNVVNEQMGFMMGNSSNKNIDTSTKDKTMPHNQSQQTPKSSIMMLKVQNKRIDYCSILQTKIQQLSNNIAILHQKVTACDKSHQSINSQSLRDENKMYPSTMETLDSRHVQDSRNMATINNRKSLWERQSNKKQRNKLIYHDSKIIFSQNDSGYENFSEEFSQVLINGQESSKNEGTAKSLRSQSNVKIIVHNENSPLSIDIQQQMNHVLGFSSGKSQRVNNSGEKCYNLFGKPYQQQDLVLQDDLYFNNGNEGNADDSLLSSVHIQKESFRLSFPKLYTQNQQSLSCSHQQSSPKLKSHQSFMSQSSNQTFIQQQISNKKFNNKFNQWLMMS